MSKSDARAKIDFLVNEIRSGQVTKEQALERLKRLRAERSQSDGIFGGRPFENFLGELKRLMAAQLDLTPEEVEAREDLSRYGFDSISLTRFAQAIEQAFPGIVVEPEDFLKNPTLEGFSRHLFLKSDDKFVRVETPRGPELSASAVDQARPVVPETSPGTDGGACLRDEGIAIVGIALDLPGASDPCEFWAALKEDRSYITPMPEARLQLTPASMRETKPVYGAFLDSVADFDAEHFGISPRDAVLMDPQHRILMMVVWKLLENAGYGVGALQGRAVGMFVGCEKQDYAELLHASGCPPEAGMNLGNTRSMLANRISHHFGWVGPSLTVDTACSSSLAALKLAINSLRIGECEAAVVAGSNLILTPTSTQVNRELGLVTQETRMKTYQREGSGGLDGEGVVAILVKPVSHAIADGDHIFGVVKGIAVRHGGRSMYLAAPNPSGQQEVIATALEAAGLRGVDVDYVEGHGTGHPVSDAVELSSFASAYARENGTPVGTLKGNYGNLGAASGVAATVKVLMSLSNGALSGHPGFDPKDALPAPGLRLIAQREAWPDAVDARSDARLRRAAVHNVGYGGVAGHALIEAPPSRPDGSIADPKTDNVFPFSARSEEQLRILKVRMLRYLEEGVYRSYGLSSISPRDLAYTLTVGREPFECREAIVAANLDELCNALRQSLGGQALAGTFSGREGLGASEPDVVASSADRAAAAAEAWARGSRLTWGGKPGRRIPLPTYPFKGETYWIEGLIAPEPKRPSVTTAKPAPTSTCEDEAVLAALLEEARAVLPTGIEPAPQLKFSEAGLDSALVHSLTDRINARFATDFTPVVFFEHGTLVELANAILRRAGKGVEGRTGAKASLPATARVPATSCDPAGVQAGPCSKDGFRGETPPQSEPVAIIGMSGRFPKAGSIARFWDNLRSGTDCIEEIPRNRWDWKRIYGDTGDDANRTNIKWGGFIDGIDLFDAAFFGISPREAEYMDPQQKLLLEETWAAIEDSGYAPSSLSGTNTAVFVATASIGFTDLLYAAEAPMHAYSATGMTPSIGANRISYLLNLHGPSQPVETACSSSLISVHRAVQTLRTGTSDLALAGGVNTIVSPAAHIGLSKAKMLSPEGRCKTFSRFADGYVRGEGVAVVVLKRLTDALRDGDNIYAVIRGSAENHGGRSNSLTAPNLPAQVSVMAAAYRDAGIDPETVGYLETHGTATPLGDPIEIDALKKVFSSGDGASGAKPGACGIGSVKSVIGHLELAAGIAGLVKTVGAFRYGELLPTLHCDEVNPYIDLDGSPFRIVRRTEPWPRAAGADGRPVPRRAGVSSFGIGGVNCHLLLEEAPARERPPRAILPSQPVLIPLSARSRKSLDCALERLAGFLAENEVEAAFAAGEWTLDDLAFTFQSGRNEMKWRAATVVRNIEELKTALNGQAGGPELWRGEASKSSKHGVNAPSTVCGVRSMDELERLAAHWVEGGAVEWCNLRDGRMCRRIPLPTYCFDRKRYWIPGIEGREELFFAPRKESSDCKEDGGVSGGTRQQPSGTEPARAITRSGSPTPGPVSGNLLRPAWSFKPSAPVEKSDLAGALSAWSGCNVLIGTTSDEADIARDLFGKIADLPHTDVPEYTTVPLNDPERLTTALRSPVDAFFVFLKRDGIGILERIAADLPKPALLLAVVPPPDYPEAAAVLDRRAGNGPVRLLAAETTSPGQRVSWAFKEWLATAHEASVGRCDMVLSSSGRFVLERAAHPEPMSLPTVGAGTSILIACTDARRGLDVAVDLQKADGEATIMILASGRIGWKEDPASKISVFNCDLESMQEVSDALGRVGRISRLIWLEPDHGARLPDRGRCLASLCKGWRPAKGMPVPTPPRPGGDILLIANGDTGPALQRLLEARFEAPLLTVWIDGPDFLTVDAAKGLANRLLEQPERFSLMVDAADLYDRQVTEDRDPLARLTFYQSVIGCFSDLTILHLTRGLQSFGGGKSLAGAKFIGLVKMLSAEYGHIRARTIDLDPDRMVEEDAADIAVTEAACELEETEICYREDKRYVPQLTANPEVEDRESPRIRPDHVYLVSGGTRGIGLEVAHHLVDSGARQIVLLSQHPVPHASQWQGLAEAADELPDSRRRYRSLMELQDKGAMVRLFASPLGDRERLSNHVVWIKRNVGPIAGVVHSAGAYSDMEYPALFSKRIDGIRRVLEPKVEGLQNLYDVCADESLDFFIVFTSLSGHIPRLARGLADYAMANAFADAFAAFRRAQDPHSVLKAVTWSDWSEAGRSARLKAGERTLLEENLGELGILPVDNRVGRILFDKALSRTESNLLLSPLQAETFLAAQPSLLKCRNKKAKVNSGSASDKDSVGFANERPTGRGPAAELAVLDAATAHLGLDAFVLAASPERGRRREHDLLLQRFAALREMQRIGGYRSGPTLIWRLESSSGNGAFQEACSALRSGVGPEQALRALAESGADRLTDDQVEILHALIWPEKAMVGPVTDPGTGAAKPVATAQREHLAHDRSAVTGVVVSAGTAVDDPAPSAPEISRPFAQNANVRLRGASGSNRKDIVTNLLKDVLKLDAPPEAGAEFQSLGLDSISGTQYALKLEEALGIEVPPRWLFDHPSLNALVEKLEEALSAR